MLRNLIIVGDFIQVVLRWLYVLLRVTTSILRLVTTILRRDACIVYCTISGKGIKIVSIIRKYHNHKLQTNRWHRKEEPHKNHETL